MACSAVKRSATFNKDFVGPRFGDGKGNDGKILYFVVSDCFHVCRD